MEKRLAMCPTCRHTGYFLFLGEQHWPVEIARKLNVPADISLWRCPACQTTVSEPDLLPPQGRGSPKSEVVAQGS
ncbi:MAG TPA: hypothetical protein VKQ72_18440 [Aggregatilineales bacterium]|nr:hypothetical protein [Aggregatilineales bacterium]